MKRKIKAIVISIIIAILIILSINAIITIKEPQAPERYDWENDGIFLMQHETEGFYGCFGCNNPKSGPALCIDPAPVMKLRDETTERYCGEEFEVITN